MSAPGLGRPSVLTRRLELRPYRDSDWRVWRRAYVEARPAQSRWDLGRLPAARCTRAEFRTMAQRHRRMAEADETYVLAAFQRRGGALVGCLDLHVLCRDDRQLGNLGYKVHNRHWRRGYGVEMARAGLEVAFSHLRLNRMEAVIDPDNLASIALARRLPMRELGLRRGYLWEDGAWVDQVVFEAEPPDLGLARLDPPSS